MSIGNSKQSRNEGALKEITAASCADGIFFPSGAPKSRDGTGTGGTHEKNR